MRASHALDRYIVREGNQIEFELSAISNSSMLNLNRAISLRKRAKTLGSSLLVQRAEEQIGKHGKELIRRVVDISQDILHQEDWASLENEMGL